MTKCKNPEQILLMVVVIDHILHFVKLGRILFSAQAKNVTFSNRDKPKI